MYTAGLDAAPRDECWAVAGPFQKMCGAGSVLGLDFGEHLTSLVPTNFQVLEIKFLRRFKGPKWLLS